MQMMASNKRPRIYEQDCVFLAQTTPTYHDMALLGATQEFF